MLKQFKLSITLIALLMSFSTIFGQVVYQEETVSNGFMGKMAFKSSSSVYLAGDAKYQTSKMEFTGSFMKHFNSKSNTADITRLDKGVFWNVNYDKKEYTETTFDQIRKMFEEGMTTDMMPKMTPDEPEKDEEANSEYEWQKPVVKVTEGNMNTVNGFKCKNFLVEVIVVGKHKATGILDTLLITNDMWNSVVVGNTMKEIRTFDEKLIEALGFEKPAQGLGQIFSSYKEYLGEMSKETAKLEGYPVKSNMRMTSTDHAKASQNKSGDTEEQSTDVSKDKIGGMLGGFAKKMAKKAVTKKETGAAKEVFQYTTELKSIKREDIPASKFDVPAGFKKIEVKLPTQQ